MKETVPALDLRQNVFVTVEKASAKRNPRMIY